MKPVGPRQRCVVSGVNRGDETRTHTLAPKLPRLHRPEIEQNDEGSASGSFLGYLQGLFVNHRRPVAAAMIGATAMPLLVGALLAASLLAVLGEAALDAARL